MTQVHSQEPSAIAEDTAALRHFPLTGAVNFRDLGGYLTSDGRRVKWRHVYRSDSLADLTDTDAKTVASLGLRVLLDLRHESEREKKPNRPLPGTPPATHPIGFLPRSNPEMLGRVAAGTMTKQVLDDWYHDSYRRFPQEPTYAQLVEKLRVGQPFPLLIHCTSGKDRTGFAAAVVLMALGVPRQTIIDDFMLSNRYRRDLRFLVGEKADQEVLEVLASVRPSYLEATFDAIDAEWGSDEAYLRRALGLSEAQQKALQDTLLESSI